MGLIRRILGNTGKDKPGAGSASGPVPMASGFHESQIAGDEDDEEVARANRRREIIKVMLRETMRQHGIPAEWIECRILSTMGRNNRPGMHVSFVVHQAHDKLLGYIFAFQDSFRRELLRFEPQAKDWGFTVGWQFEGDPAGLQKTGMPDPKTWEAHGAPPQAVPPSIAGTPLAAAAAAPMASLDLLDSQDTEPSEEDDVEKDLAALFAIRDAVLAKDLSAAEEVEAQQAAAVAATDAPPRRARRGGGDDESLSDFEPTRPFDLPPEDAGAKPR